MNFLVLESSRIFSLSCRDSAALWGFFSDFLVIFFPAQTLFQIPWSNYVIRSRLHDSLRLSFTSLPSAVLFFPSSFSSICPLYHLSLSPPSPLNPPQLGNNLLTRAEVLQRRCSTKLALSNDHPSIFFCWSGSGLQPTFRFLLHYLILFTVLQEIL